MSRSRRRTPVFGNTVAGSEKQDKVAAHRRTRRAERTALAVGREPPDRRLTEDPWTWAKDGRQWVPDPRPELMRR